MFQWTDKGRENGSSMLNVMRNKDLAWVVSRVYDDDDEDDQSLPECGGMNEAINVSDTPITTVMLPILQARDIFINYIITKTKKIAIS